MTGTVVNVLGQYYTVLLNGERINCVLRGKLRQDERLKRYNDPVATGDVVDFDFEEGKEGVINSVDERRNVFSRLDYRSRKEDIIATNLDLVVVIQSFKEPKLNLRFVDRILVRAEKEHIPALLCVNKVDLVKKKEIDYVKSYYENTDIELLFTSALKEKGLDKFRKIIEGKTSILVGNSGVGKSTILNRLYPELDLRTSEISKSTGKGKHTTTNVEMMTLENRTGIIDTPGFREFGLMDIEPHMLDEYFSDIKRYAGGCNFRTCTHDHEPGCEIKKQVENGSIFNDRYISYLNIYHSLREQYEDMY